MNVPSFGLTHVTDARLALIGLRAMTASRFLDRSLAELRRNVLHALEDGLTDRDDLARASSIPVRTAQRRLCLRIQRPLVPSERSIV